MQAVSLARTLQTEKAVSLFGHVLGIEQRRGNRICISAAWNNLAIARQHLRGAGLDQAAKDLQQARCICIVSFQCHFNITPFCYILPQAIRVYPSNRLARLNLQRVRADIQ